MVDLFAGAGGFSVGASYRGIDVVAGIDNWIPAENTYKANFSHPFIRYDLSDVNASIEIVSSLKPDIIVGGPPCQDFSTAGKKVEGERAALTVSFAEIVKGVNPTVFIMENVTTATKSRAYEEAMQIFSDAGYRICEVRLNAAHYGVPQARKRVIVIGTKHPDNFSLRERIHNQSTTMPLSVIEAIPKIGIEHYYRHPRTYMRRAVFSVSEPSPTIRGINRPRPANYVAHPNDTTVSKDVRTLTASERALIQTFGSKFQWVGTRSEVNQMLGNAVPPELANRILVAVARHLSNAIDERMSYLSWLEKEKRMSAAEAASIHASLIRSLSANHRESGRMLSMTDITSLMESQPEQLNRSWIRPRRLYLEYQNAL